ncbi:MAG: hypothetical protein ABJA81_00215, partial [Nocardioidaceae bacterium]
MHTMFRRAVIVAGSAMIAATSLTTVAPAQLTPKAAVVAPRPILTVGHAADSVTLEKYSAKVDLALGVYAVAGDQAFEVRAHRPSYFQPIQASLITTAGDVALPPESMNNFSKIKDFFGLRVYDRNDKVVLGRSLNFCPAGEEVRIRPDAPAAQGYPQWCPFNPYTKGGVYGVDAGYATAVLGDYGARAPLDLGRYTAKVWVAQPYRDLLGVSLADATTTVNVHVIKAQGGNCVGPDRGCKSGTPSKGTTKSGTVSAKPNTSRPTGAPLENIAPEIKPDLQSLPAFAVSLHHGFVSFAATVWNSGPSPLVVDGFRRADEDVMDAFQYFYDADGNQVGYVPAGSMEWDPRHGHQHWHFRDFARYRLLDADKNAIVRSRK